MNSKVAIGIDVGGTKIAAAAVDLTSGRILCQRRIHTHRDQGGADVLMRMHDLAVGMHQEMANREIQPLGVGIGVPELVDNTGNIKSAWNFDWKRSDVLRRLAEIAPVRLESDARTGALAESHFGNREGHPSFIFATIGTGLSFAFWSGGHILRGANGYAIHFASGDIMPVCSACGVQAPFNLEALASGRGLAETFQKRAGRSVEARAIVDARAGEVGEEVLDQAVTALASYLGQLVNIFDPHAVIIGGGLGTAPTVFGQLEKRTRDYIWAEDARSLPILVSSLGSDYGVIGAAALFMDMPEGH